MFSLRSPELYTIKNPVELYTIPNPVDTSNSYSQGLGYTAVESSNNQVIFDSIRDDLGHTAGNDKLLGDFDEDLCQNLTDARDQLSIIPDKFDPDINQLCDQHAPDLVHRAKANSNPYVRWRSWLTEHASDEELLNFLQWNTHTLEAAQAGEELHDEIIEQKEQYTRAVKQGATEEWLHECSVNAVNSLDVVRVFVGDAFDTFFKERAAYCQRGLLPYIVVGGSKTIPGSEYHTIQTFREVATHEFNHAVLGWFRYRWLKEAATEHISLGLNFGEPEILNPHQREHDSDIYASERMLLYWWQKIGGIPILQMTRAYSDSESGKERTQYMHEMNMALLPQVKRYNHVPVAPLELMQQFITRVEHQLLQEGKTPLEAGSKAVRLATTNLIYTPKNIFGTNNSTAEQIISETPYDDA